MAGAGVDRWDDARAGETPVGRTSVDGSAFEQLNLTPAYRVVFETIEQAIVEGRLKSGERLPTETSLAHQLGVNRSTTREGLRLLEQSGLVQRRDGRRLYAAVPRQEELATRTSRALNLQQVTFRELWQLLMALEPAAAELACETISADELAALQDNLDRTRAVVAAGESFADLDREFHGLIATATRNRAWLLAYEPAAMLLFPADELMMPRLPQAGRRLVTAHEHILAAMRAGDAMVARQWMHKHIVDFRRGYEYAGIDLDAPVGVGMTQMKKRQSPQGRQKTGTEKGHGARKRNGAGTRS